uniref:tenascin-X-like isoform X2 n=1 Tax=Myxine glutinosa TaxID=7769 RepID=UPI00358F282F
MEATQSAATVTWIAPKAPLTNYHLTCGPTLGGQPKTYTVAPDATQYTVRDLESGVEYSLILSAMQNLQRSQPTVLTFSTLQPISNLPKIVITTSATSITLKWSQTPGVAVKVVLQSTNPYHEQTLQETTSESGYIIIDGLNPGEEYTVTISVLRNGQEVQGPIIHKVTTSAAPQRQVVDGASGMKPVVSWERVDSPGVTGYQVRAEPMPDQHGELVERVVGPDQTSVALDGLTPGVRYRITVSVINEGDEDRSPTDHIHTGTTELRNVQATYDEVRMQLIVTWEHSSAPGIVGYRVQGIPSHGQHGVSVDKIAKADQNILVLDRLTPGIDYIIIVSVIQDGKEGGSSTITVSTALNPPREVHIVINPDTAVPTLMWQRPNNPELTAYRVHGEPFPGQRGETLDQMVGPDQMSFPLDRLTPNVEYRISISAVKDGRESSPVTTTLNAVSAEEPRPTNVRINFYPDTMEVVIIWESSSVSGVTGYKLRAKPSPGQQGKSVDIMVRPEQKSYTLEGLTTGVEYIISISAVKNGNEGPAVTATVSTAVPAPSDFTITNVSDTSVVLRWSPLALDTITGYRVTVSWKGETRPLLETTVARRTGLFSVHGLEPGIEYDFSVTSLVDGGESLPIRLTQSTALNPPREVHIVVNPDTAVPTLMWQRPNVPEFTAYRVHGEPFPGQRGQTLDQMVGPDQISLPLDRLTPNVEYRISISAVKDGRESSPVTTTLNAEEPRPTNVRMNFHPDTMQLVIIWESSSVTGVTGYKLRAKPSPGQQGKSVDIMVRPEQRSYTLEGLTTGVEYIISISAVKNGNEGPAVTATVSTAVPAPSDFTITNVSDSSVVLRWSPLVLDTITGYRVTVSLTGETRPLLETTVARRTGLFTVHGLEPGIEYDFSVTSLVDGGESLPIRLTQSTVPVGPKLEQVDYNSDRRELGIAWQAAPSRGLNGYRVTVAPTPGQRGEVIDRTVEPEQTSLLLEGLSPGVEYRISVSAIRNGKEGHPATTILTTTVAWPELPAPTDLSVNNITDKSVLLRWTPLSLSTITGYRLAVSLSGDVRPLHESTLDAHVSQFSVHGLESETQFDFSIVTLAGDKESQPIVRTESTALQPPRDIQVVINSQTGVPTLTWKGVPGVTGYRVQGQPLSGQHGEIEDRIVEPSQASLPLDRLTPGVEYRISISAIKDGKQGQPATVVTVAAAKPAIPSPSDLSVSNITESSVLLHWTPLSLAAVIGYRVTASLSGEDQSLHEVFVGPHTGLFSFRGLQPGTIYDFGISTMTEGAESRPIVHRESTAMAPPQEVKLNTIPKTGSLTVSWKKEGWPGVTGYRVRGEPLPGQHGEVVDIVVGPEITSASLDKLTPGTEYSISVSVIKDGREGLPTSVTGHKDISPPGSIRIERDPESGAFVVVWQRVTEPGVVAYRVRSEPLPGQQGELDEITVGPEQTYAPLERLTAGVEYIISVRTVMVGNKEGPPAITVINSGLREPEHLEVETDPESGNLIVAWQRVAIPGVTGYRVRGVPLLGQVAETEEKVVRPDQTSTSLDELTPGVWYKIIVSAIKDGKDGLPTATTAETALSKPGGIHLEVDSETGILTVMWDSVDVPGITGYHVQGVPLNGQIGHTETIMVRPDKSFSPLERLTPGVEYSISVSAVKDGKKGLPATTFISTDIPQPEDLDLDTNLDTGDLTVTWQTVSDPRVTGYRVRGMPLPGQQRETEDKIVRPDETSTTFHNLNPGVEYRIIVSAVKDDKEGLPATITIHTELSKPKHLQVEANPETGVLIATWQKVDAPGLTGYRIRGIPLPGQHGVTMNTMVPPEQTFSLLDKLTPGTQYIISVLAVQNGKEGPPAVATVNTDLQRPENLQLKTDKETGYLTVTWERLLDREVTGYRVRGVPLLYQEGEMQEKIVRPDQTSVSLEGLNPGVEYKITVSALKDNKVGIPASMTFTTDLPEPDDVNVESIANSGAFLVMWQEVHVPGVTGYRVRGVPLSGQRGVTEEKAITPDQTFSVLEKLTPGVEYTISVSALKDQIEGPAATTTISTGLSQPDQIHVEPNQDTGDLTVTWQRVFVPGITGYRVRGVPLPGQHGETEEVFVRPDKTSISLNKLTPGVEYKISVSAVKDNKEGLPATTIIKTDLEQPKDLNVETILDTGALMVTWQNVTFPGVTGYRVRGVPLPGQRGVTEERLVGPKQTFSVLERLTPGVEYRINVSAVAADTDGPPATTVVSPDLAQPKYIDVKINPDTGKLTVMWERVSSREVTGYKVLAVPLSGQHGENEDQFVRPDQTYAVLDKLSPGVEYRISVSAVTDGRNGRPATTIARTGIPQPEDLLVEAIVNTNAIMVTWQEVNIPGGVTGYRVQGVPLPDQDGETEERLVGPQQTFSMLERLTPGVDYLISVVTVKGDKESSPATTIISTGPHEQLEGLDVNTNRDTGILTVTWERVTNPEITGFRIRGVPLPGQNGETEDRVVSPYKSSVSLDKLNPNVEYKISVSTLEDGKESLPSVATIKTGLRQPEDLNVEVFPEMGALMVTWQKVIVPGGVMGYRVQGVPIPGQHGETEERVVGPEQSFSLLDRLTPGVEYLISVLAFIGDEEGPPATTIVNTDLIQPDDLVVKTNPDTGDMIVTWQRVSNPGVSGYHVRGVPLPGQHGEIEDRIVRANETSLALDKLTPAVEYRISVSAIKDGKEGLPATAIVTTELPRPGNLHVETVASSTNLIATWQKIDAPGVTGYQVHGIPLPGQHGETEENMVGPEQTFSVFTRLSPGVEYVISVMAIKDGKKGPPATAIINTALDKPKDVQIMTNPETDGFTVRWQRVAVPGLTSYRVRGEPLSGQHGVTENRVVGPERTSIVLRKLTPNVEYRISVSAIKDGKEGLPGTTTFTAGIHKPENIYVERDTETGGLKVSWQRVVMPGVTGYRVRGAPLPGQHGETEERLVGPKETSTPLVRLTPGVEYRISVSAVRDGKDGPTTDTIINTGLTKPEYLDVETNPDTGTLTVTWERVSIPGVKGYKVRGVPLPGQHGETEERIVGLDQTSLPLDELTPGVVYMISVSALKEGKEGIPATAIATTGLGQPKGLEVEMDMDTNEFIVTWERVLAPGVTGYQVRGDPLPGQQGHTENFVVGPEQTSLPLNRLTPGVEYRISVAAVKNGKEGPAASTVINTGLHGPQDLNVMTDATTGSLTVTWERVSTPGVTGYWVRGVPLPGQHGETEEKTVGPDQTGLNLDWLTPDVEYKISVSAVKDGKEGLPSTTFANTGLGSPENVLVGKNPETGDLTVSWEKVTSEGVIGYRVLGVPMPSERGETINNTVGLDQTSLPLDRLTPGTVYIISVSAMSRHREGQPSSIIVNTALQSPDDLEVEEHPESGTLTVTWERVVVPGVTGYRVRGIPLPGQFGETEDRVVGPAWSSLPLDNLTPGVEYKISVSAVKDGKEGLPATALANTGLGQPKNLDVIISPETGALTLTWQRVASPGVTGYMVRSFPLPGHQGEHEEQLVGADQTSIPLHGLTPGVEYRINVSAVQNRNEGPAATTTINTALKGPKILDVETSPETGALTVTWQRVAVPGVSGYRVRGVPLPGEHGETEEILVGPEQTSMPFDSLTPGIGYTISVSAVHGKTQGPSATTTAKTGLRRPEGLDVETDPFTGSLVVSWQRVASPGMTGYRLRGEPLPGQHGQSVDRVVGPSQTSLPLDNLTHGVEYKISVSAIKGGKEGPAATTNVNTELAKPKDLHVESNPDNGAFTITWKRVASPGVTGYRVRGIPLPGQHGETEERLVGPDQAFSVLDRLTPGIEYRISVSAIAEKNQGPSATTNVDTGIAQPKDLNIETDQETGALTVTWKRVTAPGVTGYRVRGVPLPGQRGEMEDRMVGPEQTSLPLNRLTPGVEYRISVSAVTDGNSGLPTSTNAIPGLQPPTDLAVDTTAPEVTITWQRVGFPGVIGYRVQGLPLPGQGGQTVDQLVGPLQTSLIVDRFTPGVEYRISVSAIKGKTEGPSATTTATTMLSAPKILEVDSNALSGKVTITWQRIVSPGVTGYRVRGVPLPGQHGETENIVVGPEQTSVDFNKLTPGVEYRIIVSAVKDDKDGPFDDTIINPAFMPKDLQVDRSETGEVTILWQRVEVPGMTGYRIRGVPIDGQEGIKEDTVVGPMRTSLTLDTLSPGVEYKISVSGLKDKKESLPISTVITTVIPPPTDLSFSAVSTESFHISWKPPHGVDVEAYSIRFAPLRDVTNWSQVTITDKNHRAEIHGLTPGKEYLVSVHSMIGQHESVALSGTQKTDIDPPTNMVFSNVKDSTFTVHWESPLAPITGYRALYSVETLGPLREELLPSDQNFITFTELYPSTEYTVSVFAVADDRESWPLTGKQLTKTGGPTDLVFSKKTPTSFVVSWNPPPISVRHYRLNYKETGSQRPLSELSIPSGRNSALIQGLLPGREYRVALHSVTSRGDNPTISKPLLGIEKTEIDMPRDLKLLDVADRYVHLAWQPSHAPVSAYRVELKALDSQDVIDTRDITHGHNEVTMEGLQPTTKYSVSVRALGNSGEITEPISLNFTTNVDSPKHLEFTNVEQDSFTLSWKAPQGPLTGYRVKYYSSDDDVLELRPAPQRHERTAVLTGLQLGTEYTVAVSAFYGAIESRPAIATQATVIPPPSFLQFPEVTPTSITVQWPPRAPSLSLSGYRVVLTPKGPDATSQKLTVSDDVNSVVVSGLQASTKYNVLVYALKGERSSEPVEDVISTMDNIQPPRKLKVMNVTDNSIKISWHARKNPSISFLITAKPTVGLGLIEKTTGPDARLHTIEGLEPGMDYIIKLYSVVGLAKSYPVEVMAKTAIDAPTDLQLESATTKTITLSWKPPLAHITGYRVFYSSPRRHRQRLSPSPGPFENQITLRNLAQNTKYTISIYAVKNNMKSLPLVGVYSTVSPFNLHSLGEYPSGPSHSSFPRLDVPIHFPTHDHDGEGTRGGLNVASGSDRRYQPRRQPDRFSAKVPHIGQLQQFHVLPSLAPPSPELYQIKHNPHFQRREMAAPRYGNINTPARDAALNPHQAVHTGAFRGTPQQVVWAPGAEATLKPPTISWSTLLDATEYIVSCFPISGIGSSLELRFPAKTTSATLTGLVKGSQYNVVVEAVKGGARYRIHEEVLKTPGSQALLTEVEDDFCLDTITRTYYAVGQDWERISHQGILLYCRCLGYGHGHYRCDSSRWCHDNGRNYNEGDTWDRPAENGQMQSCTCLGRSIGEYKCEAHHASCYDEGHMYEAGEKWQKMYRGDLCSCTCLGGQQGWRCEDCRAVVEDVVPDTRHREKSQPQTVRLHME